MRNYFDTILNADTGRPLIGAQVLVLEQAGQGEPAGAVATIYSDDNGTVADNPLTVQEGGSSPGFYQFYAEDGFYTLRYLYLGQEIRSVSDVDISADVTAAQLVDSGGAGMVGYLPLGTGAEVLTQKEYNDLGPIYVETWRDGIRTDTQILNAAFAAWQARGGTLHLDPGRIYDLGTVNTQSSVFILDAGLRQATLEGNGASLTIETVGELVNVFYLFNYEGVTIRNLSLTDTGTLAGNGSTGARLVVLDSNSSQPSKDITLDNLKTDHVNSFLCVNTGDVSNRIDQITILGNCRAERTFYAINCQGNGDNLTADITAINGNRAYLPYGIRDHKIRVRIENEVGVGFGADCACIVVAYANETTQNIDLEATFAGTLVDFNNLVSLEFQGANAVLSDIKVNVHVEEGTDDPDAPNPDTDPADSGAVTFMFRAYAAPGDELPAATTANIWRNISLGGTCAPGTGRNIRFATEPLTRTVIALDQALATGYMNGEIVAPNVALKTALGSEFYLKTGNLVFSPFVDADFSTWPDGPVDIRATLFCYGSLATPTNVTCDVRTIHGTVASGSFTYVDSDIDAGASWDRGTATTFDIDDGAGTLAISANSGEYDNADSFAKVTFEYLGLRGAP